MKIVDYEVLLKDLDLQITKFAIERTNKVTRKDILDTIAEFFNCDPNDKENWQKIIDVFVYDFTVEDIEQ